jgi:hypothetical protein
MLNLLVHLVTSRLQKVKSRIMKWVRHMARMVERRSAYRMLVGKPEQNRPL